MVIPYVLFKKGDAKNFNRDLRIVLKKKLFFIVCCDDDKDTLLEAATVLRTFHSSKGLFLNNNNLTSPTTFFQWCWQNGFLDVLLWTRSSPNNILRYEQFPNFRVLKIPEVIKGELFNAEKQFRNINGHPIRTPAINDPPRVLKYFNPKINKTVLGGYSYKILDTFIRNVNGTFSDMTFIKKIDIQYIEKLVVAGDIDIFVHAYIPGINYSISYPISTPRWEIMVPVEGKLDPYLYFILPFEKEVWLAILITLFYISVMSSFVQYAISGKFKWLDCCCEVLLRSLNMSSEVPLHNRVVILVAFKLQLILFAFIINNLYLANLTKFFATDSLITKVDTLDALIQKNIKVLFFSYEADYYIRISNNKAFEKNIVRVSLPELDQLRNKLKNTTFAYTLGEDRTFYYFKQQERLKRPLFRVMEDCLMILQFGFPMPLDSPFLTPLDNFITRILQSGLIHKWEKDGIDDGILSGDLDIMKEDFEDFRPVYFRDLHFAWLCLIIGITMSILAFIGSWISFLSFKKNRGRKTNRMLSLQKKKDRGRILTNVQTQVL